MPTFAELQNRVKHHQGLLAHLGSDEMLIADQRSAMRPGDFVEQKLRAAQQIDIVKTRRIRPVRRD